MNVPFSVRRQITEMLLENKLGGSLEPIREEISEDESEGVEEDKDKNDDNPIINNTSQTSLYGDNQIHLSYYYPYMKRLHNKAKHEVISESEEEEEDNSNDMIGIALRFYHHMSPSSRIRFFETIFVILLLIISIGRRDIFIVLIVIVVVTMGLQTSVMIPHSCYRIIMAITALSMIIKYTVQLPVFNQCVSSDGIAYLTFLTTCKETGTINENAFQPLSLIGITTTEAGQPAGSLFQDIIMMMLYIVMRAVLKRNGVWEKSINHYVMVNVQLCSIHHI